ncbi:hypothetical protein DAPPUDRAFT_241922 [Daphnia pulex]|uniref:Uncharacterized protein n=1 Tax=Daphnia pulex TaxID=6669 RepID=E9GFE2_DAPPU|nr:hypothetical protein DAPPUDRAFT_241922 [Daphnia pulex]|eukprot:EFX81625.1 hypothetical protein DAPPUDRAFT_241922 [Daphnia pulex]
MTQQKWDFSRDVSHDENAKILERSVGLCSLLLVFFVIKSPVLRPELLHCSLDLLQPAGGRAKLSYQV